MRRHRTVNDHFPQSVGRADDFTAAGNYASEQKLKQLATKAWKRAVELDPAHEAANKALGNVLYKGTWMSPEERDKRQAADEEAEMLAKGLVRWKEQWVTPAEKEKLEKGLILRDGQWLPRRAMVTVAIDAPVMPASADWNGAIGLRDAARRAMLAACGEPDLALEQWQQPKAA